MSDPKINWQQVATTLEACDRYLDYRPEGRETSEQALDRERANLLRAVRDLVAAPWFDHLKQLVNKTAEVQQWKNDDE